MAAKWANAIWVQDANALGAWSLTANVLMLLTCSMGLAFPFIPAAFTSGFSCLSHTLLGIPCPACGYVRSTHALLQGDLLQALRYNPAWLFWVLLQGSMIVMAIRTLHQRRQWMFSRSASIAICCCIGAAWIFKLCYDPA